MMKHSAFLLLLLTFIFVGCGPEKSPSPSSNSSPESPPAEVSKPVTDSPSSLPESQAPSSLPDSQASADEVVQQDVRKMVNAVYQADVTTVLEYTHPKIIEMMGGESNAQVALEGAFSQLQSIGMKLDSFDFPAAPKFLETNKNRFAIVPTLSILSANGKQIESLNYQLGIQSKGATTWKYIEGSRINNQNVRSFFPDFPPDYVFPEVYRKKL